MRTKRTAAGALALGAALFGWWSCSGEPSAEEPDGGETDAGGAAGSGGGGGSGALPTGGSGGIGGAGGSAGWGAYPKWEATTAVVDGCPIERLVNAKEVRVFEWEPCEWSPNDCEQAVFNTALVATNVTFSRMSRALDDGDSIRVGLSFIGSTTYFALYASDSGQGLDGFRDKSITSCDVIGGSLWGDRFAVRIKPDGKQTNSGLVGKLGDPTYPTPFQHGSQPPGGAQGFVLGSERWVWWWAPAYAYTSVSTLDGSDYRVFAKTALPNGIVALAEPTTTGKTFLFQAYVGDDAGIAHGKIMWSDGIVAPQTYLEPADPNDDFGSPMYAHTHVAFMRGVNRKDINKYDSTELWASAYSEDPSKLAPSLIGQLPYQSMGAGVGGWGRVATTAPASGGLQFMVRDFAAGTERAFFLPEDHDFAGRFLGMTRTHLWIGAGKLGVGGARYLVRYRVE